MVASQDDTEAVACIRVPRDHDNDLATTSR
jgi:hypothetical protein